MSFKLIHRWYFLRRFFHTELHFTLFMSAMGYSLESKEEDLKKKKEMLSRLDSIPICGAWTRSCFGCCATYSASEDIGAQEPNFPPLRQSLVASFMEPSDTSVVSLDVEEGEEDESSSARARASWPKASLQLWQIHGAFGEMVQGMGVVLLAFSVWLCIATIKGGGRIDRRQSDFSTVNLEFWDILLDVVAAFWYLIFVSPCPLAFPSSPPSYLPDPPG